MTQPFAEGSSERVQRASARPGDVAAAFEQEALPHLDSLYRTARRLTGNARDAEDAVQEAMLRAFRFFHQFERGTNCRAWLMRILHNVIINTAQRRARIPVTTSIEGTDENVWYGKLSDEALAAGVEDQVLSTLWDNNIVEALDRLPIEYRTVVVLCDIEDMAYRDIASTLDVPIGTVRSRLARGRRLLARYLADQKQTGSLCENTGCAQTGEIGAKLPSQ